jgi:hypothetical protein
VKTELKTYLQHVIAFLMLELGRKHRISFL